MFFVKLATVLAWLMVIFGASSVLYGLYFVVSVVAQHGAELESGRPVPMPPVFMDGFAILASGAALGVLAHVGRASRVDGA